MSSNDIQEQSSQGFEAMSPISYTNKAKNQHLGNDKIESAQDSHSGLVDGPYDLDALIDVVAYLLERRWRRLATAESEGVN